MKIKIIDREIYTISIDKTKNRIYFQLHNYLWKVKDMDVFLSDWKGVIKEVQVNFTILSDIRNLHIQSPNLDKSHEEIQKYVSQNGLLQVARILPDNDIVNLQFGRIIKRSAMPSNDFMTLESAEKYLDEIVRKFEESQENDLKTN
ncbi:hypothetical protein Fleli_3634 [Bernardetia litoralis DSM 6794]|uniref:Uncharacterized protein n=1 Tax=Bernardetia litoralis (strain ATCC 23117 / DSM 6794 / NBRC 15988 / NCIMB 1366 / Fx l1 / Sio-4) TaxID=880071 RepID=I4APR5_BERLS|nr:hypothetical protein [Bernardetia litoralis]AFM05950.1 hypothetical protein Fleli_3634 [Bernardetia litoralis DSM 6794]